MQFHKDTKTFDASNPFGLTPEQWAELPNFIDSLGDPEVITIDQQNQSLFSVFEKLKKDGDNRAAAILAAALMTRALEQSANMEAMQIMGVDVEITGDENIMEDRLNAARVLKH